MPGGAAYTSLTQALFCLVRQLSTGSTRCCLYSLAIEVRTISSKGFPDHTPPLDGALAGGGWLQNPPLAGGEWLQKDQTQKWVGNPTPPPKPQSPTQAFSVLCPLNSWSRSKDTHWGFGACPGPIEYSSGHFRTAIPPDAGAG